MSITRRKLLAGSAAALLSSQGWAEAAATRRNFVFITIDDLMSVTHSRRRFGVNIRTPNLNRLMAQGVTFSNAFASTALCNPSRTSIFSGANPFKTGVHDNAAIMEDHIDFRTETFVGRMATAGWRCFSYGKLVHGDHAPLRTSGICEQVYRPAPGPYQDRDTVTAAVKSIRANLPASKTPWLFMVGLHGPHWPGGDIPQYLSYYPLESIQPLNWSGDAPPVPVTQYDDFLSIYEPSGEMREMIQGYLADVTAMDAQLGRLLDAIDTYPNFNPIVILTSDHGYALGHHDAIFKSALWDDIARAPLVIRSRDCPAGLIIPETVSLLDIATSFLHRAGLPIPNYMDGKSLFPLIMNPTIKRTSGAMTTMGKSHIAAGGPQDQSLSFRDNRYRITRYAPGGELELYDQIADPDARNNLADAADEPAHSALKDAMLAKLDACYAKWTA